MNYAQCRDDQKWRIKFGSLVITDILRFLKGHTNKLKYVTVFIFTKQHAYILREFLQFLPRFSTWNPINEPGRLSTNLLPLLTMLRCYGSQRFKNQLDKPSLMYCVTWLSKIFPLFIWPVSLCVIHNLIFQCKLSRRRLPIPSIYFVRHASSQAFRTTRHLFSIQLLW